METEGIVLKRKKLSNKLCYLSVFLDNSGKIDILAKIDLRRFPLSIEPFSISNFKLKFTGEKPELVEVKLIKQNFPETLNRYRYLSLITGYMNRMVYAPNKKIYELSKFYLSIKNTFLLASTMFLVKLSYFEGIYPQLYKCTSCNFESISGFSLEKGGVVCKNCMDTTTVTWNSNLSSGSDILLKRSFNSLPIRKKEMLKKIRETFEKHIDYRIGNEQTFER